MYSLSLSEIFYLKAILIAWSLCWHVCIGLPGPVHPPKKKYSVSELFLLLVLSARIYVLAFQTNINTYERREQATITALRQNKAEELFLK